MLLPELAVMVVACRFFLRRCLSNWSCGWCVSDGMQSWENRQRQHREIHATLLLHGCNWWKPSRIGVLLRLIQLEVDGTVLDWFSFTSHSLRCPNPAVRIGASPAFWMDAPQADLRPDPTPQDTEPKVGEFGALRVESCL